MDQSTHAALRRIPCNKGKLVGQKTPLKLKDIWAIGVRLQIGRRTRELALFNLAIDNPAADEGDFDLPTNKESASGTAATRTHQYWDTPILRARCATSELRLTMRWRSRSRQKYSGLIHSAGSGRAWSLSVRHLAGANARVRI